MARLPKPSGLSRLVLVVACLVGSLVASIDSLAYTAAGDRIFAPTGILPQIAPTNQIYGWAWTVPQSGEAPGTSRRATNIGAFFDKTVFSERLSVYTQGSWFRIDRVAADPRYGWANFENGFKYSGNRRSRPRVAVDAWGQSRMGRHRSERNRGAQGHDRAAGLLRQGSGRSRYRLSAAVRHDRVSRLSGLRCAAASRSDQRRRLPSSIRSPTCNRRCKASISRL